MTLLWTPLHRGISDSTMADAREALARGRGDGTVCTAGTQRRGRGRISGRRWDDGDGSLLLTAVLDRRRFTAAYSPTQTTAWALCRHLQSRHGLEPSVKWPNDVLVRHRKIAGILVETEGDYLLVGIGLNVLQVCFPEGLRRPATSVRLEREAAGREPPIQTEPRDELPGVLEALAETLADPPPIHLLEARLEGRGDPVEVNLGDPGTPERLSGILRGLSADGAAEIIAADGTVRRIYSGEIIQ